MHKIQNLGLYVLDAQGSRAHEGEWPNKPGSQYQTWHNTLTPYLNSEEIQWIYKDLCVIRDHNGPTCLVRRYNGSIKIYVSLGTIMDPSAYLLFYSYNNPKI